MKAGIHNITINRGGAFGELLSFVQSSDNVTPIDLTGLSPFTAEVRDRSNGPLVIALTVTDTDLEDGKITISATSEDTLNLRPRVSKWGLIDVEGNLYAYGTATIQPMIPEL